MYCVLFQSEIYSARLQLVILSPTFLNHIQREPSQLVGRLGEIRNEKKIRNFLVRFVEFTLDPHLPLALYY